MQIDTPRRLFRNRPELERLQRHIVEPCRLLVGKGVGRTIAGTRRVVDGLLGLSSRRRLKEVVGEVRERLTRSAVGQSFERIADAPVEPYAARRGQLAVQRLADQRVLKAEPTAPS